MNTKNEHRIECDSLTDKLDQLELDELRGGTSSSDETLASKGDDQDSGHGTSNCCNSGW